MKQILPLCCLVVLSLVVSLEAFALSYEIDPQECIRSLRWNRDFTRAQCKMRNGVTASVEGASAVNFALPIVGGQPRIEGFIRPLSNGYILTLKAEAPMSPEQVTPLLTWALGVVAPNGIEAPIGLCAKLLTEAKAVF